MGEGLHPRASPPAPTPSRSENGSKLRRIANKNKARTVFYRVMILANSTCLVNRDLGKSPHTQGGAKPVSARRHLPLKTNRWNAKSPDFGQPFEAWTALNPRTSGVIVFQSRRGKIAGYAESKHCHHAHRNHARRGTHVRAGTVGELSRLTHPAHERWQAELDRSHTALEPQAGCLRIVAGGTDARARVRRCPRQGVHRSAGRHVQHHEEWVERGFGNEDGACAAFAGGS